MNFCNNDEHWWLIRNMCTSVRLLGLCHPVSGSWAVTTDWPGEQTAPPEQGHDLQAAGHLVWVSSVGSACCPIFVGLTGCCSLCTMGVKSRAYLGLQHHPVASPKAIIVLPVYLFIQIWPFYICSQSDFTNRRQDDILIVTHFTKRFTIVHF